VPWRNHLVDLFSRKKFGEHTCFIEFYVDIEVYVEVGRLLLFTELPRRRILGNPYPENWDLMQLIAPNPLATAR
jgi:hypothetical protein